MAVPYADEMLICTEKSTL